MAARTRRPVALAMACSLRCFSCSAFHFASSRLLLLLRMMHRAGWIGAHLMDGADVAAFGDDGLGGELAHLELGPLRLFLRLRLVVPNGGVLVARQDRAAFLLLAVGGADLHQLRFRGDGLGNVRVHLGLIAAWVGASVLLAEVGKQQLVVSCPLGAVGATASGGDKLRVALVERSIFEDEQDVLLNPELQVADGQQNALGLAVARCAPVLFEASRERLFLLVGWQLRQQAAHGLRRSHRDRTPRPLPVQGRSVSSRARRRRATCQPSLRSARCCTWVLPSREARKPCASSIG